MNNEPKPRLARLTAILTQLQSQQILTAREIAEKHQVSIRTVYRDIRTLEQSGVPIVTEEGKGYSLMQGYNLPPVMFTQAEANALITVEQLIAKQDHSLTAHYKSAIIKIKSVLQHSQKAKTELLAQRIHIRENDYLGQKSQHLVMLQTAITQFTLVELQYCSMQNEISQRIIEPFAVYSTQGNWLLIAFCRLRNAFRTFRLDHIQKLKVLSQYFEPHPMTLPEYFEQCRKKYLNTPDIPLSQASTTFAISDNKTPKKTMDKLKIEPFKVIGITVRTSNQNGQGIQDIGALWERFINEGIFDQIPNKIGSEEVYSVYTDYEGDHTQPYTTLLGCKVSTLDQIPEGMEGKVFEGGQYQRFAAQGNLTQGVVGQEWNKIWQMDLPRAYTADFEIYGEKAKNPENAEVDILIALS